MPRNGAGVLLRPAEAASGTTAPTTNMVSTTIAKTHITGPWTFGVVVGASPKPKGPPKAQ